MVFSMSAVLVCAVVPNLIITSIGGPVNGPAQKPGYAVMAVIFGILFALVWVLCFKGTYELHSGDVKPAKIRFSDWFSLFKNRSYRLFLAIYILICVTVDLLLALLVFYVDIVLLKYNLYTLFMGLVLGGELICMAIWGKIAQRRGKRFPLIVGIPVFLAACCGIFFLNASTPVPAVAVVCLLVPIGLAAGNVSIWSMLSDQYDVGELMTGKRSEGLYSGVTTFFYKLASGLAILCIGLGLQSVGFNQDEYNILKATGAADFAAYSTSDIVITIRTMLSVIPAVLMIAVAFFLSRYRLNSTRFSLIQTAVERFKSQGLEAQFTPEETKELELVTGKKVTELWGRS
jgi:oligogalacturonide transporter